jgi:hypothetical protein
MVYPARYNKMTQAEYVESSLSDFIALANEHRGGREELKAELAACQKEAKTWLESMSHQGLDGVLDLVDGESTTYGSFAGTSYMALPLGIPHSDSPKGLGIYVGRGKENVMLAMARDFEAHSKGSLVPWPKGFGPHENK